MKYALRERLHHRPLRLCHTVYRGIHCQLIGFASGHGCGLAQGYRSCFAGCPGLEPGGPLPQLDRHG